jgi:hypothetical protein
MAQVVAAPAQLDLQAVATNPFAIAVSAAFTDFSGDAVPWSEITGWAVSGGTSPEITSPSAGVVLVSWTPAQTSAIGTPGGTYGLSCYISGFGPFTLIGGVLGAISPFTPGVASVGPVSLSLAVGLGTVALEVARA